MKKGIVIEISTTSFDEAITICEESFNDCRTNEWLEVKESRDFNKLAKFLKSMDVKSKVFKLY